jgi:hypothetical protein
MDQPKSRFPLMFQRILVSLVVSLLFPLAVTAQESPAKSSYEALIERVKKDDSAVDFGELRLVYSETKEAVNPSGKIGVYYFNFDKRFNWLGNSVKQ